ISSQYWVEPALCPGRSLSPVPSPQALKSSKGEAHLDVAIHARRVPAESVQRMQRATLSEPSGAGSPRMHRTKGKNVSFPFLQYPSGFKKSVALGLILTFDFNWQNGRMERGEDLLKKYCWGSAGSSG